MYQNGVYNPNSEDAVRILAKRLLGDTCRMNKLDETLKQIVLETKHSPDGMNKDARGYINVLNGL